MSGPTKIEWAEQTWNPIVGCSLKSPGCKHCYAMKDAWRLMHNPHPAVAAKFAGTAELVKGKPVWTGRINLDEAALLAPLRRKVPTDYFVNSMSDLFHDDVADETIDRIFAVMALCPQHRFKVLTKRSARMREYLTKLSTMWHDAGDPFDDRIGTLLVELSGSPCAVGMWEDQFILPHVWLGVSVEDQQRADERIPDLLATPAAVRWLSCEPLLGPVDLGQLQTGLPTNAWLTWLDALDWVVAGGESGPRARPMHPDWARTLRDQCADAGVPFFFKQWGEWASTFELMHKPWLYEKRPVGDWHGQVFHRRGPADLCMSGGFDMALVGKKIAGRSLDGIEHNGFPA